MPELKSGDRVRYIGGELDGKTGIIESVCTKIDDCPQVRSLLCQDWPFAEMYAEAICEMCQRCEMKEES